MIGKGKNAEEKMAKRGKKKCVSRKGAEFFKVFLPQKSHHRIMIPPDFVKDFKRTIREKAVLKDVYGKKWHIHVKETLDGFFLENGWESYVQYHSLKFGEFLVFRYDGEFSFIVKIFGASGCKKKKEDLDNACVKVEDEIEDEMEEETASQKHPREDNLLIDFNNEHSERFEEVKESEEQNVDSECLSFISPSAATKRFSRKLRIPDELINEHNLKFEKKILLRNENGMQWSVNTFQIKDAKLIGKGWYDFQIDNNMRLKDRCKLTFDNKSSICRTANVQILRSGPDSSHKNMLKRGRGRPKKKESDNIDLRVQVMTNSYGEKVRCSDKANSSNEKVPNSDELPEFFKFYMPDMSSEMSIPPDFIEEFGENIPKMCTLENLSGLSWKVDMNRVDDDWFFQNGWPQFVHENSLQDRDFLTFAYACNSTFYVKVYSRNCCLKMPEKTDDETPEILLEDEASEQENPDNRRNTERCTRKESPIERNSLDVNPSFKLQITKSYVTNSFLTIPMPFWRLHIGKMSGMVALWIKNERWNMSLKNTGDRINLVGHVPKFIRMNSLKIGTVCTFKLIDSNKLIFEITVD